MKNNTEPEKVKNILGDIWNNYFNSGVSYGGDIESFIMGSPVPDKIVKLFGKIAEDSIRNLDVEGVRRLIPHNPNNRKAMINMLLSYGISQKIINEALTYLNDRYDLNYELLSDEDSNNLQESIRRIHQMMGLNESFLDWFKPEQDINDKDYIKSEEERFTCTDCGDKDYNMYMVNKDLWDKYGNGDLTLCKSCLEKRMGRKLTKSDISQYKDAKVNIFNPEMRNLED
jgi:hypothetical protein